MIKKLFIALAIVFAPMMLSAAVAPAQAQAESSQDIPIDAFVREFNKECPQEVDAGMVIKSADYRGNTNSLVFNITVDNPELTADVFQYLANDPQMSKELASGFLSNGGDDLKSMLVAKGCSVIFAFIFPREGNQRVEMTITPQQIRNF